MGTSSPTVTFGPLDGTCRAGTYTGLTWEVTLPVPGFSLSPFHSSSYLFKKGTCGNSPPPELSGEPAGVRESCIQKSGEVVQTPAGSVQLCTGLLGPMGAVRAAQWVGTHTMAADQVSLCRSSGSREQVLCGLVQPCWPLGLAGSGR